MHTGYTEIGFYSYGRIISSNNIMIFFRTRPYLWIRAFFCSPYAGLGLGRRFFEVFCSTVLITGTFLKFGPRSSIVCGFASGKRWFISATLIANLLLGGMSIII
jgi:hypothetical protein